MDVRILEPPEISLRLVVAQAQLRVERAKDEVETREDGRIRVARAFRGEVHLDAAEDHRARATGVHGGDVLALSHKARLVHSVRDAKRLRVIGDGDAFAPDRRGRLDHVFDRRAAVGLVGVHLMIRARHVAPLRVRVDDGARVRVCDEAIA